MAGMGGGWNPTAGWDTGSAAPVNPPVTTGADYGGAYAAYASPSPLGGLVHYPGGVAPSQPAMPGPPFAQGPVYTMPANGYQPAVPVFGDTAARYPQAHPVVNAECPALNLQNSTGGMGCEPGYNYYFPAEHTKIHVVKSADPPWRVPAGRSLHFGAYHVPVATTLADLMKGFGAVNPLPRKNKITEVTPGGSGRWYKGITFCGDEPDNMKKTLKELGWDRTRTGRAGEKPVVWLWVTKD